MSDLIRYVGGVDRPSAPGSTSHRPEVRLELPAAPHVLVQALAAGKMIRVVRFSCYDPDNHPEQLINVDYLFITYTKALGFEYKGYGAAVVDDRTIFRMIMQSPEAFQIFDRPADWSTLKVTETMTNAEFERRLIIGNPVRR